MKLPRLALVSILVLGQVPAIAQIDDFNDGDDAGWTRLDPLAVPLAIVPTFSFPNGNSYRMSSPGAPETPAGQARVGSIREEVSYTDFYVSVDLVDILAGIDQNVGILARVTEPGFGTLDGYAATYNAVDQKIYISAITNEALSGDVAEADAFPVAGNDLRLIFRGQGTSFRVELFDLADLSTPIAFIDWTDATYASGVCGIFNSHDGFDQLTDSTFDNYFAADAEPIDGEIVSVSSAEDDQLEITFLSKPGKVYELWESADLKLWVDLNDNVPGELGDRTSILVPTPGDGHFYKIRVP